MNRFNQSVKPLANPSVSPFSTRIFEMGGKWELINPVASAYIASSTADASIVKKIVIIGLRKKKRVHQVAIRPDNV
jgi:fructose-specific phosphotransferase system IIC component